MFHHSDTFAVPSMCNAVCLLIKLKLCHTFTFLQQLVTKGLRIIYTYTCQSMSSRQPRTTQVFADSRIRLLYHALRICVAHALPESCPSFLLVRYAFRAFIEIVFHYSTTPVCHKIDLFKRPIHGSHFERLDDAFVVLISLIFFYLQKSLFLSNNFSNFRMYSIR